MHEKVCNAKHFGEARGVAAWRSCSKFFVITLKILACKNEFVIPEFPEESIIFKL